MHLSKEEYARKRIHNGYSVQIENFVTLDDCSASLGKPHDAKHLPLVMEFSIQASQTYYIHIWNTYSSYCVLQHWRNVENLDLFP